MIKPEELTQPGWYLEHFASKDVLVYIPSIAPDNIHIQDYDLNTLGIKEEEDYEYRHLKNYMYTYICAPMPISEFQNLYPEYFI